MGEAAPQADAPEPIAEPAAEPAAEPRASTASTSDGAEAGRQPAPARGAPGEVSTRFDFVHKVFQVPGALFCKEAGETWFQAPLGGASARAPLSAVRREFGIDRDDNDFELLVLVERALDHVRQIRPGDCIPSELLDGSASWRFEPAHEQLARGRIYSGLTSWAVGEPGEPLERGALIGFDAGEVMAEHGEDALGRLARNIGAPGVAAVRVRLDKIAREYAYVEALRDHFAGLYRLPKRLEAARAKVERDRNRREEYDRMLALVVKPLRIARQRFNALDALVGDTPTAVGDEARTIACLRRERDKLHVDTMAWREVVDMWDSGADEDERRRATYRYLASNFAEAAEWGGGSSGPSISQMRG